MAKKKKSNTGGILIIILLVVVIMSIMWAMYSNQESAEVLDDSIIETPNLVEVTPEPIEEPSPVPEEVVAPETTPVPTITPGQVQDASGFDDTLDPETISNDSLFWSFKRNEEHLPVQAYTEVDLESYGAYYQVETDEKVIYLTFDNGYEQGYTASILDTLLEHGVKAAFFVTKHYIVTNPELVIRMKEEGHIVGNHSATHPDFSLISVDQIEEEIMLTADTMAELTGYDMDLFLRPPRGTYSERSLYVTRSLGYRSIFWSLAYVDWEIDNQPGKEAALSHVMTYYHKGCIMLLHAVSESNTEALGDMIEGLKAEGYRFGYLFEVE